ncbi:hypothetical protein BIFDEN_00136 [Bifidobacterium dentium ATCC 27678]|nr:hypothetical protein BIFDEN_00136 [Bifidobacterium dentium ATCC 27678]
MDFQGSSASDTPIGHSPTTGRKNIIRTNQMIYLRSHENEQAMCPTSSRGKA